jgi:hypothetical protein
MQEYSQAEQQPVHRRWPRPLLFSFVVGSLLLGLACGCGSGKPTRLSRHLGYFQAILSSPQPFALVPTSA